MIAEVLRLDGASWLILLAFASVITIIGAALDGWSGVGKAWGFVAFMIALVFITSDGDPNEHCEYDYAGNEYCLDLPRP